MNWADISILVILVLSTVFGVMRGFVREALSLVVWVLAFWLAIHFAVDVGAYFANYIETPSVRVAVGFISILLAALIVGGLINRLISGLLRTAGLGGIDRLLGILFGFLRAILIIAVLLFLMSFMATGESWWKESLFIPYFQPLLAWLWQLVAQIHSQQPPTLG